MSAQPPPPWSRLGQGCAPAPGLPWWTHLGGHLPPSPSLNGPKEMEVHVEDATRSLIWSGKNTFPGILTEWPLIMGKISSFSDWASCLSNYSSVLWEPCCEPVVPREVLSGVNCIAACELWCIILTVYFNLNYGLQYITNYIHGSLVTLEYLWLFSTNRLGAAEKHKINNKMTIGFNIFFLFTYRFS